MSETTELSVVAATQEQEKRRFRILGMYIHIVTTYNLYAYLCSIINYQHFPAGTFLGTVGGAAAIFGFSKTLMSSKQEEQKLLEKGLIEGTHVLDAGSALARRALGYGTLYAVLGCGLLTYGIWKLSGATNVICWKSIIHFLFLYFKFEDFFVNLCAYVLLVDGRVSTQNGNDSAEAQ